MTLCVRSAMTTPPFPSWIEATAVNTTSLYVTWSPSNQTSYYQLTCVTCGWNTEVNVSAEETTVFLIGGLDPGASYTVFLEACSSRCSDTVNATNNTCKLSSVVVTFFDLFCTGI